jgi:hypothetical protein
MLIVELIETHLHKAETLGLMIERLYGYYQKSVFLFFLVHPSFYFVAFVSIYLNLLNFYMIAIFFLKGLDIFFKIELMRQRFVYREMEPDLEMMMQLKMSPFVTFLSSLMYVPLLAMALFS